MRPSARPYALTCVICHQHKFKIIITKMSLDSIAARIMISVVRWIKFRFQLRTSFRRFCLTIFINGVCLIWFKRHPCRVTSSAQHAARRQIRSRDVNSTCHCSKIFPPSDTYVKRSGLRGRDVNIDKDVKYDNIGEHKHFTVSSQRPRN